MLLAADLPETAELRSSLTPARFQAREGHEQRDEERGARRRDEPGDG